jgi:hypothetical protein
MTYPKGVSVLREGPSVVQALLCIQLDRLRREGNGTRPQRQKGSSLTPVIRPAIATPRPVTATNCGRLQIPGLPWIVGNRYASCPSPIPRLAAATGFLEPVPVLQTWKPA